MVVASNVGIVVSEPGRLRVASATSGPAGVGRDRLLSWWRAGASAALLIGASQALAIGLGTAVLDSGLGEPLRLSVPVTADADEEIGCIQVRARGADLPSVFNTRSNVVRSRGQTRIEISSAQAVNEPAIGLVVSVGCSSPVAREFALLLDPPFAPSAPVASIAMPRSVVDPVVPRGLAPDARPPRRPVARSDTRADAAGVALPPSPRAPRPKRLPRVRPPATVATAPVTPPAALPRETVPAVTPPVAAAAPKAGDRLSVAPVEPKGTTPSSSAPGVPQTSAVNAPPDAAPAPPTAPDADAIAREEALRQQQDALQSQIKSLNDQIAALRVQTSALATRNQALEDSAFSPTLVWLLIALAVIAIVVAGWMAWRYTQLRRQLEGSAWWTGNTVQAPSSGTTGDAAGDADLAPLESGTRLSTRVPTRVETRTTSISSPAVVAAPVAVDRPRPAPRPQSYPPAIETDFTVSDIEAAMATVRTVSPPRRPAPSVEDSDFAALGGPTLPSPFTEPPPAVTQSPAPPPPQELDPFVDLDIPPMAKPSPAVVPPSSETAIEPTELVPPSLDFKLDTSTEFDPLSTDSHKNTIVERTNPGTFEAESQPTALDFELPSVTSISSLTMRDAEAAPRHGSAALDNLFATDTGTLGPDTILDLDDRHGSPLSATEVDRLTAADDAVDGLSGTTVQGRMARFAELMNQVDEAAGSDPLRAVAQLRQFVLRDENIPTLLWLRLFDLYKAVDKRMVYEALADHFARRYDRPMVGWNETLADRVPQTPLAAIRELDREIEDIWGTEAGLQRLQSLLCGRNQPDEIVFNAVLQRDLLDAAKIFLLDRDSSISRKPSV